MRLHSAKLQPCSQILDWGELTQVTNSKGWQTLNCSFKKLRVFWDIFCNITFLEILYSQIILKNNYLRYVLKKSKKQISNEFHILLF